MQNIIYPRAQKSRIQKISFKKKSIQFHFITNEIKEYITRFSFITFAIFFGAWSLQENSNRLPLLRCSSSNVVRFPYCSHERAIGRKMLSLSLGCVTMSVSRTILKLQHVKEEENVQNLFYFSFLHHSLIWENFTHVI